MKERKFDCRENFRARRSPDVFMNIYLREESGRKFNILTIKEMVVTYKCKFSKSHHTHIYIQALTHHTHTHTKTHVKHCLACIGRVKKEGSSLAPD